MIVIFDNESYYDGTSSTSEHEGYDMAAVVISSRLDVCRSTRCTTAIVIDPPSFNGLPLY